MPVEFLTDEQAEAYGTFAEEPTRPELERFFFLDDVDRDLIVRRRSTHHQLGFALQMCTVRYIGRFLPDGPLDAPWPVIEHLAAQLGIEDPSVVERYTERPKTAYEHAWEIRDAYEYREYEDAEWPRRFRTFLHGRAWTHAEGPKALFDHAVGWLRRNRVLLPGVSVLARQVSDVRKVADRRLHATVAGAARRADAALPGDLGYNFSPRFRDLDDQRFWRATMPGVETGTYGVLEDLARNRVNLNRVITQWPDMLRVAGSLVTNQVRAYDLLRMFGREGRPAPLGQAFAEYGRIARTEHLLRVVDPVDDTYRRQMNRQLTVQESRHKLARDVCHGKRGTIHQAYRDGMEDQPGALGLVLDAIVLWTTRYVDAAVAQLQAEGHELRDEDIARLSPLKHRNLNLLGRYSFPASTPAAGALRPLRDPDAPELDEDESAAD
ncbi:Tn3 family transposase [Streptomyces sp. NPDC050509]|uniref:Tn3 family transposase n=1 Tax=Streptomyces sp. NPDC050509 TaxID=3365620 RepID=UPI003795C5BB